MQYTKYFSYIVSINGSPKMSSKGFKTYMNIVSLECRIDALEKARKHPNINSDTVRFIIYELSNKLKAITREQSPEDVFKSLYYLE